MTSKGNSVEHLPVIGPGTCWFAFPKENPDQVLNGLTGDDRLFASAELSLARCEFAKCRELYDRLRTSARYSLAAIRIGVVGAIGLGDVRLFDQVLKDLETHRRQAKDRAADLAVEMVKAWIRQHLWIPEGYPEWICRFDLEGVPAEWRDQVAYLGVRIRLVRTEFESAYATAALMMNYDTSPEDVITARRVHLRIIRAIACRETGRREEMMKWLREVVREICPHGFLQSLMLVMDGVASTSVQKLLAEEAPAQLPRYRALSKSYYANFVKMRNHFTGERVSDKLSLREMYLAILLRRGLSYKEIAERFGITVGRTKNLVAAIYGKLGVNSRKQLKGRVW